MKHGERWEAQADGIHSSECRNREGLVLRKSEWCRPVLLSLTLHLLGLPLLQSSTSKHSFKCWSVPESPHWEQRLSAERELCIGGTLRADPEEPFYGEGHRERGGWLSSGTENQRYIQILSNPLHLARWTWETDSQVLLNWWQSSNYHHSINDISNLYLYKECLHSVRLKYLPLNSFLLLSLLPFCGKILSPTLWMGLLSKERDFTWTRTVTQRSWRTHNQGCSPSYLALSPSPTMPQLTAVCKMYWRTSLVSRS